MGVLIAILFIALFVFFVWRNSARQKGKRGEMRVSSILSQLPDEYSVLNDLVYRTERGTTQIDHVVVSQSEWDRNFYTYKSFKYIKVHVLLITFD